MIARDHHGNDASSSTVTLTLTARDTAGNSLTTGGLAVTFITSGGVSTGTIASTTDNNNGTYSAMFTGVISGAATSIQGKIGGSNVTSTLPTVTVTAGAYTLAQSVVSVSSSTVASGATLNLTMTAKDAAGNQQTAGGLVVTFVTSGGTSTGTIAATTDNGNGTYTAVLTGVASGTATSIQGKIAGSNVTSTLPTVTVTPGAASLSQSLVTVSGSSVTSGNTLTLTMTAKDASGNQLTSGGLTVTFVTFGGSSTGTIGATTDNSNGTYTAVFTGVLAGTATSISTAV